MPRAKKVTKRKGQKVQKGLKGKYPQKKKKEEKVITYDPAKPETPIPNDYVCWCEKVGASLSVVHPVKIKDKRLRRDVTVVPEGEHKYEYYVHFEGMDKRMDTWVQYKKLRFTGPKLDKEEKDDADHKEHHDNMKKVIQEIQVGKYIMPTWYFSPFPQEYHRFERLLFCEFCLNFFGHMSELKRHSKRCKWTHPPGTEIYRSKENNINVAMFEVDGKKEEQYTQNICYIAKLFLEHKNLVHNTHPFLFYVLCEVTPKGCVMVGYFSKEKSSEYNYNLACICTLPCHQKKGFGKFLISMSYELSKIEGKQGSPETPISDLGQQAYNSYWRSKLIEVLSQQKEPLSVNDLCTITSMTQQNVIETFKALDILQYDNRKDGHHISIPESIIKRWREKKKKLESNTDRIYVRPADPKKIRWYPFHAKDRRDRMEIIS